MGNERYEEPELRPGYAGNGTIVYEPLSALSLTQRLGRLRFACYQFTSMLIAVLVLALIMLLAQEMIAKAIGLFASIVVGLLLAIYLLGLMVRRLHDTGRTGWWALCSLVPGLNLVFMLYLFLAAGSSMVNRYGTPNPPPGVLVMLAGGLFWLLNVLNLLMAVVLMFVAWQFPGTFQDDMQIVPYGVPHQLRQ